MDNKILDNEKKIDNSKLDNKKRDSTDVDLNKEFLDNHLISLDKEYDSLLNRMNKRRKEQFKNA
jgi:hypothetical protein